MDQMNPVMVFGSYHSWKLNHNTHIINFMDGTQNMYLLEGSQRALLIDTGWGAGNLRAFIEKLTDKPILVINTHCHPDHAGGNGEWPSVMMLTGGEKDLATCAGGPFDLDKLPFPNYRHEIVHDGDVIDLGNRKLEVMDISAHSNGSLALWDHEAGQLFVGDELESAQVIMHELAAVPGVEYVLEERLRRHHANMQRLRERLTGAEQIFPAHNGAPIAQEYIDDYIELVEKIYDGDAVIEDKLNHRFAEMDDPEHRLCRIRWKGASFFVVKEDLLLFYGSKWRGDSI